MIAVALKKPFSTARPRAQWRKPVRRVFGRIRKAVNIGTAAEPVLKRVQFELTATGLVVRPVGGRKARAKTWPFEVLANVVKTQIDLFPGR